MSNTTNVQAQMAENFAEFNTQADYSVIALLTLLVCETSELILRGCALLG